MSLDHFHPAVQRWFSETLGTPTAVQQRGWAAVRGARHTLIAAPTGSGKTLAAFLGALDDLLVEGLRAPLPDEVRVVYVSPLKALSADIHKNLAEPRRGIRRIAEEMGLDAPRITAAVRTGDTTQAERAAMLKKPPHILVTTPESLYLLLTAERSRNMLRTARTVIVDEIHAVIGTRRGAHLALTLERLQAVANAPLLRLGLSATQKPIDDVARWLAPQSDVEIIDEGHRRALDLAIEIPRSSVETVMANEVWEEYYDRLTALIGEHRTTLVFVNTRRMAERVARHLSDRLGAGAVTAHHGSLAKETRLDAESRLKSGQLKALVATASLELGIDIGHVDLVCQIGSPHRIATLLQRVGRSGHTIAGMPKGRLFPISRDDLVECAALVREVRRGALDAIVQQEAPLDVLAQQIVAESSCDDYDEDALFALFRRAHPYRNLDRSDFDDVLRMVADGFATKRGRRGALVHRDEVNRRVRGRRGARMLAITSGGAIPEVADYKVVLEPDDTVVGTLNEDFAIESTAGDIFQLGNASWQIMQVAAGTVRVIDAKGAPPTIPFWLGEAPARSDELSRAVSELRVECAGQAGALTEIGLSPEVAQELAAYLDDAQRALGAMPSQDTLVAERFFDEAGGMQLVIHAPFGSRINKAWGLALRKRFCRQFNFELQAAATEDAILLSLGPQHSFPLADVFRYLHPATARDVLVQALLAAPVFPTRWRWNTTVSLAIPRNRGGRKVPPPLQRAMADDLMAAVFPDAAACPENLAGDRELPDHPLVKQVIRDCLEEAMDFEGLTRVLERIHAGEITCLARDTTEPSPLAHEILNAKPYAFLDDAPLEERRTQAVLTRRTTASDLGALDPAAIERVRDEERPDPRDADELHDALLTFGFLVDGEVESPFFEELAAGKRAAQVPLPASGERVAEGRVRGECFPDGAPHPPLRGTFSPQAGRRIWVAAERASEVATIHEIDLVSPRQRAWTREEAIVELLRGRLALVGPTTAAALASSLGVDIAEADAALLKLESEGVVLRGSFESKTLEWCDRRLLARIHRYTLNRLRAEIEPVSLADFTRYLFAWQHATPATRLRGIDGLRAVLAQLDGVSIAERAWEKHVLPLRIDGYAESLLDTLCLSGEVRWAQQGTAVTFGGGQALMPVPVSERAQAVLDLLRTRGPMFARDLDKEALDELTRATLVTCDGFLGRGGRWSILEPSELSVEAQAHMLLRRYGVVCRRILGRESNLAPWRELARVYRRLEERGEIRGGRFVTGMSGEQFALPEAVERLREIRRTPPDGRVIVISAADPLNLAGVRAHPSTRIAYRDGIALSVMEGDYLRPLAETSLEVAAALAGRRVPVAAGFVGR